MGKGTMGQSGNGTVRRGDRGVALLSLIITLIVMQIMMMVVLPEWSKWNQRQKELELIWRGRQYVQAIEYYYAQHGKYPPSIEALLNHEPRLLRRAYPDPFQGEWELIREIPTNPQSPIRGVRSRDPGKAIIPYQGKEFHNQWEFVFVPQVSQ